MPLIRPTSIWRQANPRGLFADFMVVFRQAGRNRWRIGALSAACTAAIFSVMWNEEGRGLPKPPQVTYITSWIGHRTDAEIAASNLANQKRKERLAAEQARRDEEVRQMYKSVGRMTGLDVDAMESRINAERKAQGLRPLPEATPQADPAGR